MNIISGRVDIAREKFRYLLCLFCDQHGLAIQGRLRTAGGRSLAGQGRRALPSDRLGSGVRLLVRGHSAGSFVCPGAEAPRGGPRRARPAPGGLAGAGDLARDRSPRPRRLFGPRGVGGRVEGGAAGARCRRARGLSKDPGPPPRPEPRGPPRAHGARDRPQVARRSAVAGASVAPTGEPPRPGGGRRGRPGAGGDLPQAQPTGGGGVGLPAHRR